MKKVIISLFYLCILSMLVCCKSNAKTSDYEISLNTPLANEHVERRRCAYETAMLCVVTARVEQEAMTCIMSSASKGANSLKEVIAYDQLQRNSEVI